MIGGGFAGSFSRRLPGSPNKPRIGVVSKTTVRPGTVQTHHQTRAKTVVGVKPRVAEEKVPDLPEALPNAKTPEKLLSILIPTLIKRRRILEALMKKLHEQATNCNAIQKMEVVTFPDKGKLKVGEKRNRLLRAALGRFVVFIDDDDDIADDYVAQILRAIKRNPDADCIGLHGVITFKGRDPRQVVYSLKNRSLYESRGIYFRPPCHLTPIRREIALAHTYKNVNFGEDSDWSVQLLKKEVLKNEVFIDKVLYHYRYDPGTSATQNTSPPVPPTQRFSIVILSNSDKKLRGCLDSILENEPFLELSKIIVVDDGISARMKRLKRFRGIRWVPGAKPFIFARNVNIALRKSRPDDLILLGDDARLVTKYGFTSLSYVSRSARCGIVSAVIDGSVGNESQKRTNPGTATREEPRSLAFVSVLIPRATVKQVGGLDERFVGYGFEDNDYCVRTLKAGKKLLIYDGCVVEHGKVPSTFRTKPEIDALFKQNQRLFMKKWGMQKERQS